VSDKHHCRRLERRQHVAIKGNRSLFPAATVGDCPANVRSIVPDEAGPGAAPPDPVRFVRLLPPAVRRWALHRAGGRRSHLRTQTGQSPARQQAAVRHPDLRWRHVRGRRWQYEPSTDYRRRIFRLWKSPSNERLLPPTNLKAGPRAGMGGPRRPVEGREGASRPSIPARQRAGSPPWQPMAGRIVLRLRELFSCFRGILSPYRGKFLAFKGIKSRPEPASAAKLSSLRKRDIVFKETRQANPLSRNLYADNGL